MSVKASCVFVVYNRLQGVLFENQSILTIKHNEKCTPRLPYVIINAFSHEIAREIYEIKNNFSGSGLNQLSVESRLYISEAILKLQKILNSKISFPILKGVVIHYKDCKDHEDVVEDVTLVISVMASNVETNDTITLTPMSMIHENLVNQEILPLTLSMSNKLLFIIENQILTLEENPDNILNYDSYCKHGPTSICARVTLHQVNHSEKSASHALPIDRETGMPIQRYKPKETTKEDFIEPPESPETEPDPLMPASPSCQHEWTFGVFNKTYQIQKVVCKKCHMEGFRVGKGGKEIITNIPPEDYFTKERELDVPND